MSRSIVPAPVPSLITPRELLQFYKRGLAFFDNDPMAEHLRVLLESLDAFRWVRMTARDTRPDHD